MLSRPSIREALLTFLKEQATIEDCLNHIISVYGLGEEYSLTRGEVTTSIELSSNERVKLKTAVRQELATMKRLDILSKIRHGVYIKR
jgi:F0F1-type ATP synthase delta subunit